MTRSIIWSSRARSDYVELIRYIAERNPDAAEKIANRVERTVEGLGSFQIGRPGRVPGTYEKIVTGLPYIIISSPSRSMPKQMPSPSCASSTARETGRRKNGPTSDRSVPTQPCLAIPHPQSFRLAFLDDLPRRVPALRKRPP